MPICCYCMANVKDLARHQRQSRYCQLKAKVRRYESQGWSLLFGTGQTKIGEAELLPWPSEGRLATGPYDVQPSRRGPIVRYGVLARAEGGFCQDLRRALNVWLVEQAQKAGGRTPFLRQVLKDRLVTDLMLEALLQWVQDSALDAAIERARSWRGPYDWKSLPEYLEDRRITCERCGEKVMPSSLRAHQRHHRCVLGWMARTGRAPYRMLESPELARHPVWKRLEEIGLPVVAVPVVTRKDRFGFVLGPRGAPAAWFDQLLREFEQKENLSYSFVVQRVYLDKLQAYLFDPSRDFRTEYLASLL